MLILSRRSSEKLTIGDDITITICRVKDGQVKLGIDAPADVVVMRDDAVTQAPKTKNKPRVDTP
jgi:carbon storage regulator